MYDTKTFQYVSNSSWTLTELNLVEFNRCDISLCDNQFRSHGEMEDSFQFLFVFHNHENGCEFDLKKEIKYYFWG